LKWIDVDGCWSLDPVLHDVQQPSTYSSKMYCLSFYEGEEGIAVKGDNPSL